MNKLNVIVICVAILATVCHGYPKMRNACSKDSECRAGNECCFKPVLSFLPYLISDVGECKTYLEEGADCFVWGMTGCGCREGLVCKEYGFGYPPIYIGPMPWLLPETKGPLPIMKCTKAE